MAKKTLEKVPYPAQLEKQTLEYIHNLEEQKVPSPHHILKEHQHLVHHEEELKALLHPVQLAPVQHLGEWKPGSPTVQEIPRMSEGFEPIKKVIKKRKGKK